MGTEELLTTFGIAVGLAMDAFAVSIGLGLCGTHESTARRSARVGAHFGLFQTGMTLAGYGLGWAASGWLQAASTWISAGLLWVVGLHMVAEGLRGREHACAPACPSTGERSAGGTAQARDPGCGLTLLMLSVATSLDAFGVGVSLALLHSAVLVPSLIIGLVAAAISAAGVALSCRLAAFSAAAGRIAEIAGALVIIGIGVRIALQ